MTPEERRQFEEMQTKINKLYDVYFANDYPDNHVFNKKLTTNDFLVAKGIILVNNNTQVGTYIVSGPATNNTQIVAEQGVLPDGSTYLGTNSSQPFFVKNSGTWVLMNIP